MSQPRQGNAAAAAQQSAILGTFSGLTFDLNGVTLEVANNPAAYPAQADPDHPEWCWPTSILAMRTEVLMTDGNYWSLNRPPNFLQDGRIQVSIKPRIGTRIAVFNVPADSLDLPIWNCGRPIPTPEPSPEPTPVDPSDMPPEPIVVPGEATGDTSGQ